MSGVSVIRHLLANNAGVTNVISASSIMAGVLPQKTVLPAISIEKISGKPLNHIQINEPNKMHIHRVQVTALFKDPNGDPPGAGYPGVQAMLKLVLAACPSQRGDVNGIRVDSIVPDFEGPDLHDPITQIHSGSWDFIVKWTAAT